MQHLGDSTHAHHVCSACLRRYSCTCSAPPYLPSLSAATLQCVHTENDVGGFLCRFAYIQEEELRHAFWQLVSVTLERAWGTAH